MYAPRQRGVEPASTNRSSHHSYAFRIVRTRERVQAFTGLHIHAVSFHRYWIHSPSGAVWTVQIRQSALRRPQRQGFLPYPSRTRKISLPALQRVLECASLWETCFAAPIHITLHEEQCHLAADLVPIFRSVSFSPSRSFNRHISLFRMQSLLNGREILHSQPRSVGVISYLGVTLVTVPTPLLCPSRKTNFWPSSMRYGRNLNSTRVVPLSPGSSRPLSG